MSTDDDLQLVEIELGELELLAKEKLAAEAKIRMQITMLQMDLAKIADEKSQIRRKTKNAQKNKEAFLQKKKIEEEAALIEGQTIRKKEEALAIIKGAPWFNETYYNSGDLSLKTDTDAYGWQIDGGMLLPTRGLLGDRRGMGKSLSSLIWRRVHKCSRTLVCLRKEVAPDFIKEIRTYEPALSVIPILGADALTRGMMATLLEDQDNFIVVTNIESWRKNIEGVTKDLLKIPFDSLVLDEAHNIKNFATGTAQGFLKLSEKIPNVLEMTGTPIKNRPQEMFTLLHALYPLLFTTLKEFLRMFCTQTETNKWEFTEWGLVELIKKIKPFYLARGPEDVGREIPPPRIIDYQLDFSNHPAQQKAYKLMAERNMAVFGSGTAIPIISQLAVMTRQAQMVNWPPGMVLEVKDDAERVIERVTFDVHESVIMDWAENLVKELVEEDNRVIVFSRWVPPVYELKNRLLKSGVSVAAVSGLEPKGSTRAVMDDFDLKIAPEHPRWNVLCTTYQSLGESANLNAATHVVLLDRFWNPGNEDQAVGRIDRINSVEQATVHVPHVENTIYDYMDQLIDTKRNIVAGFKEETNAQTRGAQLMDNLRKSL